MKTPVYEHIAKYPTVYEPSEDTFLMLDALEDESAFIKCLRPSLVAEIGSGSGLSVTALAATLGPSAGYFATDINPSACKATAHTAASNGVAVECCRMDLLDGCRHNLFDVILFNPPYVVTQPEEICGYGIERSWAGGPRGRHVVDRFLRRLPALLSDGGVCYLLAIRENDPEGICDVGRTLGLTAHVIKDRRIRGEHLFVLKFQKLTL